MPVIEVSCYGLLSLGTHFPAEYSKSQQRPPKHQLDDFSLVLSLFEYLRAALSLVLVIEPSKLIWHILSDRQIRFAA